MKYELNADDKTLTVRVQGDLAENNAEALHREFLMLLPIFEIEGEKWNALKLELGSANVVDSAGIKLIALLLKVAQKNKANMQVVYTNPNIYSTFVDRRLVEHMELIRI